MAGKRYLGVSPGLGRNFAMTVEVTITDHAAAKCRKLIARAAHGHGLRVSVVEGSGSGIEYKLEIGCAET